MTIVASLSQHQSNLQRIQHSIQKISADCYLLPAFHGSGNPMKEPFKAYNFSVMSLPLQKLSLLSWPSNILVYVISYTHACIYTLAGLLLQLFQHIDCESTHTICPLILNTHFCTYMLNYQHLW